MKNMKNKLFLFLALTSLIIPTTVAFAEEEGTPSPTPEEVKPTADPTESPNPTASATPTPTTEPTPTEAPVQPSEKDTEALLEKLTVSKGTWNKKFAKDTFDYTVTVDSDVSGIIISATAYGNGEATGDIGTKSLENGENVFRITVTSKDGKASNQYTIKVVRATSNLNLKSLKIKGQNLNEVFTPTTLKYTADITYNVESVTVQAAAEDENATVTVTGSSNLTVGKNTIRITVKNQAGDSKEYQIIVTRGSEEDLNSTTDDDDDTGVETSMATSASQAIVKSENPNSGNTLKYVLVVIFCILLLAIAGIGIYFYIKTGDSQKRKQKKLEKLQKKQEKLNHELTGLGKEVAQAEEEELLEEEPETEQEEVLDEIDELEDTIELDNSEQLDEKTKEIKPEQPRRRADRNVLEDFDDLFLDE